jgi:hypothetical protein
MCKNWRAQRSILLLILTSTIFSVKSTAQPIDNSWQTNPWVGNWLNVDEESSGITKFSISNRDHRLVINMWGRCHPKDCDWGSTVAEPSESASNILHATWTKDFVISVQTLTLSSNRISLQGHDHYTDNSGRPDRDYSEKFFLDDASHKHGKPLNFVSKSAVSASRGSDIAGDIVTMLDGHKPSTERNAAIERIRGRILNKEPYDRAWLMGEVFKTFEGNDTIANNASWILVAIGTAAVPTLLADLNRADRVGQMAATTLGYYDGAAQLEIYPKVIEILRSGNVEERLNAAGALDLERSPDLTHPC